MDNGNVAILLRDKEEGEVVTVATVNTVPLPDRLVAIKNYSENEGVLDFLIENNVVEPEKGNTIYSGFVEIPIHRLTEESRAMQRLRESCSLKKKLKPIPWKR